MADKARIADGGKATLMYRQKTLLRNGGIVEMVIWRLPRPTPDRPHGIKYRLYCGRGGKCIVRYDNETGKGDHRHVLGREHSYRFVSVRKLRLDFESDVRRHGGDDDEKAD